MGAGRLEAPRRESFALLWPLPTRWMDDDHYGHVNNVVYYSYFDTTVNAVLMTRTVTDIRRLGAIGLVAETGCRYLAPVAFPDDLEVGLTVARLGTSSITYRLGLFRAGEAEGVAVAHYVHVYVDAVTRASTAIPEVIRTAMAPLVREVPPW